MIDACVFLGAKFDFDATQLAASPSASPRCTLSKGLFAMRHFLGKRALQDTPTQQKDRRFRL